MKVSGSIASEFQLGVEDRLLQRMRETFRVVGGESWFVVRPDVFAIPHLDGYDSLTQASPFWRPKTKGHKQ
jgi:hypothetical protein